MPVTQEELKEIDQVSMITATGTHVLYAVLLQQVGPVWGGTAVEIGCGNGRGTLMVSLAVGPNGRVMASDCNPSIVEGATNALRQAGASNVEISVADCQDLSYIPSDSVDFVVANLVMHLVESPSRVVGEALRILKPGGAFCFSCGGTSNDPYCFVTGSAQCVLKANGDWRRAEEWLRMTKSKGSIDGMRALLNLHGFVSVLGWAQDVALSVETPEEAAILIRANAFTRELVPPNNKDLLEAAAAQWGVLLFASRQPPMFGATCFKARKPTVELSPHAAVWGAPYTGGEIATPPVVRGMCKVCGMSVCDNEVRIRHTEGGYSHEECHLNRGRFPPSANLPKSSSQGLQKHPLPRGDSRRRVT